MSIVDAFQADTDAAVNLLATAPLPPPKPSAKISAWADLPNAVGRTLGGVVPAAVAEGLAGAGEIVTATARALDKMRRAPNMKALDAARSEPNSGENEFSRTLRNVAEGFRPDPATASTAEQAMFAVGKGLTKAIGYVGSLGPAGVAAFAADEGLTILDDLQSKGVDDKTATEAAVLTGLASGASILLPVAGSTVAKTAALAVAGGPGTFVAQQAVTRDILSRAGYAQIAEQFDPLDPVGLALSTLIPAAFGGAHAVKLRQAAKSGAGEAIGAPPGGRAPEATSAPGAVDAAMVHNLTLQQDARIGDVARADPPPIIEPPRNDAPPPKAAPEPKPEEVHAAQQALADAVPPDLPVRAEENGRAQAVATDKAVAGDLEGRAAGDNAPRAPAVDDATGLPLNDDGTVTLYHHTSAEAAQRIRDTGRLKADAEPDVYVTNRSETDTGFGDTAVPIRVNPKRLQIDDEFPDGRKDFRLSVGKPGGSMKVVIELPRESTPAALPPPESQVRADEGARLDATQVESRDGTAAAELAQARREAQEGTDFELGRADSDLLRVAAECSLSLA